MTFTEPSACHEVAMRRHVSTDERPADPGDMICSIGCHPRSGVERLYSMNLVSDDADAAIAQPSRLHHVLETMRVLIVGGIPAGALLVGLGSRVAMLVLRITSPDRVNGVESDDGFIIGRVTFSGTYNLMNLGSAIGIIGAGTYLMVSPWLIGPLWLRRATTGLAAGVVGGSMLIHADGIDFNVLQPKWLAIALFIALPGLFGTFIGSFVDSVRRSESWTRKGKRPWVLSVLCVVFFPLTLFVLALSLIVVLACLAVNEAGVPRLVRRIPAYALVVRGLWLLIAVVGLLALIGDINELT
jgi:hypothetical protein